MNLPRLYPIIDLACFSSAPEPILAVARFAEELLQGGARLVQYRDKSADVHRFLSCAREVRRITRGRATLIVNDRVDLCLAADADGVHLGQDDLSPQAARRIFDSASSHPFSSNPTLSPEGLGEASTVAAKGRGTRAKEWGTQDTQGFEKSPLLIGYSTHNLDQVREADSYPVDYIAVGPVFATASKANPDPVIGLEGVRAARAATTKPLVAIGGITRDNCRQVVKAGADSVAVIGDLLPSPVKALEEFLRILG
jgi:thiamine-phosphate pyrophosphorylase